MRKHLSHKQQQQLVMRLNNFQRSSGCYICIDAKPAPLVQAAATVGGNQNLQGKNDATFESRRETGGSGQISGACPRNERKGKQ